MLILVESSTNYAGPEWQSEQLHVPNNTWDHFGGQLFQSITSDFFSTTPASPMKDDLKVKVNKPVHQLASKNTWAVATGEVIFLQALWLDFNQSRWNTSVCHLLLTSINNEHNSHYNCIYPVVLWAGHTAWHHNSDSRVNYQSIYLHQTTSISI